jgi:hypothetical protein
MDVAVAVGSGAGVGGTIVLVGKVVGVETGVGVEQDASRVINKIQSARR